MQANYHTYYISCLWGIKNGVLDTHILVWNFNSLLVENANSVFETHILVWNPNKSLVLNVTKQSVSQKLAINSMHQMLKVNLSHLGDWYSTGFPGCKYSASIPVQQPLYFRQDVIHTTVLYGECKLPHAHRLDAQSHTDLCGISNCHLWGIWNVEFDSHILVWNSKLPLVENVSKVVSTLRILLHVFSSNVQGWPVSSWRMVLLRSSNASAPSQQFHATSIEIQGKIRHRHQRPMKEVLYSCRFWE